MNDRGLPSKCKNCKHISNCFLNSIEGELGTLDTHTTQVNYLRRQTLCKEGEFSSSIKFLISGYAMVLTEGPNKKNIIIKILKPGDFLGVSAVCGEVTYAFSAIALTDTLVCSIERESVLELMENNWKFALKLTKWYCTNYRLLLERIRTVGFKNLHGRLADAILYLNSMEFKEENLYKYLTRKDIADMACMPMESAVRLLSEFSESKLIKITGKEIEILNVDMLNQISQNG